MTTVNYEAPLKDIYFQLQAFDYSTVASLEAFEGYDFETAIDYITDACTLLGKFWLPTNRIGDEEGFSTTLTIIP